MHHMRIPLDLHQLINPNRPNITNRRQIIAPKIDKHHMLRPFFLIREQLIPKPSIDKGIRIALARTSERPNSRIPPIESN